MKSTEPLATSRKGWNALSCQFPKQPYDSVRMRNFSDIEPQAPSLPCKRYACCKQ